MARLIVRYSLEGRRVPLRNETRKIIESYGLVKIGTSVYESDDLTVQEGIDALLALLERLRRAPKALDHLWVYLDEADT